MRKALIVGIDNYPADPLTGCVNDASALDAIIKTHADGSPNFDTLLLTNVGTKAEMKKHIIELFKGKNDVALLYFSGHGYSNDDGSFLVTLDGKENDEGIPMDDVLNLANKSLAKDKIIILDCCDSGAFGSPAFNGFSTAQISEGLTILTASQNRENAIEVNGHGIFTNLLLDALSGGAADLRGEVTPGSVYAYIDQALGPWEQRPVFKTNVTRFTSLRTVAPQVSMDILRKIADYFPFPQHQFALNPSFEDTNTKEIDHEIIEPYATPQNVAIFKNLQKMQSVGLVVPVDAPYMYFAAMNSKSCKLTAYGWHYWRLIKEGRI